MADSKEFLRRLEPTSQRITKDFFAILLHQTNLNDIRKALNLTLRKQLEETNNYFNYPFNFYIESVHTPGDLDIWNNLLDTLFKEYT